MTDYPHETLPEALYAIRQAVGTLPRDSENPHFHSKFTSLPTLVDKVDAVAWQHGVLIRHQLDGNFLLHELWFNGNKVEAYGIELPNPQGTAQGLGSAITYMRRYDIVTALGLISEDDDGNAASPAVAPPTTTRPAPVLHSVPETIDEEF